MASSWDSCDGEHVAICGRIGGLVNFDHEKLGMVDCQAETPAVFPKGRQNIHQVDIVVRLDDCV